MAWSKVLNVWGFIVVFILGNPFGSFCRYRKALYFWSLGISLYLELFCFLSFITIVLRNLCSGTHRRNHPFKDQEAVPTVTLQELKTQTKRTAFYLSRRPILRWRSPIRVKSRQATWPLISNIRLTKWWQTTFKDKNGLKPWQQQRKV